MRRGSLHLHPVVLALVLAGAGCGGGSNRLPDAAQAPDAASGGSLTIAPPDAELTVENGVPATQAYTITWHRPDGVDENVTGLAPLTVADDRYGVVAGATFIALGQGAGVTQLSATYQGASGTADVTVYVRGRRIEPSAPITAPDDFDDATEDPGRVPQMVYPADHVLVPPNLGQLDVHWNDTTGNDVFEVKLVNQYVDLRVYTGGIDPPTGTRFWTLMQPQEWSPLASSGVPMVLTVSGSRVADPTLKGTTPAQTIDVTNENARGGIYYWSTTTQTLYRYDVEHPETAPRLLFPSGTGPGGCIGCHVLSRDGTKIAMTLGGENGTGTVFDLATDTPLIPYSPAVAQWNFATFSPDGSELLTVLGGQVHARSVNGGADLGEIVLDYPTTYATQVELSPDGTQLAYVSHLPQSDIYATQDSVIVRPYNQATHTVGAPVTLAAFDTTSGLQSWYPSWSPDGAWIAITRAVGDDSYDNAAGQVWAVKADGSQPPVLLATASETGSLTNSWARWVPFGQTFGTSDEPLYYLTFSTRRKFGVRRNYDGGPPQIWMTPFFPARAAAGDDPSGPAFRLPFQSLDTANHIAQWTEVVVGN